MLLCMFVRACVVNFSTGSPDEPHIVISDRGIPETNRKQDLFSDINAILKFLYFINNLNKLDDIHVYTLTSFKITDHW